MPVEIRLGNQNRRFQLASEAKTQAIRQQWARQAAARQWGAKGRGAPPRGCRQRRARSGSRATAASNCCTQGVELLLPWPDVVAGLERRPVDAAVLAAAPHGVGGRRERGRARGAWRVRLTLPRRVYLDIVLVAAGGGPGRWRACEIDGAQRSAVRHSLRLGWARLAWFNWLSDKHPRLAKACAMKAVGKALIDRAGFVANGPVVKHH
eukprot:gene10837-3489_t